MLNHNIHIFAVLLFVLLGLNAHAQSVVSPEVNDDGSITFRYQAPNAGSVEVLCDCLIKHEDKSWFGGKMRSEHMTRCNDSLWQFTTAPLRPETYQYRFIVDGNFIHDPLCKDSAYVLLHQESVVVVGGTPQADLYLEPGNRAIRGRIDTISYFDDKQQVSRNILVYVPPVYNLVGAAQKDISVLYLFHGISGDEASWLETGRAMQILDNLFNQRQIRPMLVVMPDCNVMSKIAPKHRTNLLRNMFNYGALQRCDFEEAFPRLAAYVEHIYVGDNKVHHRYVAGLSSGAKQAANIARDNPHIFSVVGLFSPVLGKRQLPKQCDDLPMLSQLGLQPVFDDRSYYVGIGKNDLFHQNGVNFITRLNNRHLPCVVFQNDGGHTWRNWRIYLSEYLIYLSQKS